MKILYHHRIASKDGQYVHVEELTKALKAQGHEIIMVGPASVEKNDFGSEGGFVSTLKRHIPGMIYELMELTYSVVAYVKLQKAIKKYKPDMIYERYNLYMPAGIWIKKKYKLPLVLEINAPLYDERSKYDGIALPKLAQWSERYTWNNADHVLPVTQVLADRVKQEGVAAENTTVIPNGIDLEKFSNTLSTEVAKDRLGLSGKLVLGFTGFIREWHGLEGVVDLIANSKNNDSHLLIVGDGPAKTTILKRAKQNGIEDRVTITGIVGREGVADYVSAFDIALQPDVVEYASPLKMFEYLALGRAIVAPDKPNIREILTHEKNALLFDMDEPNAFYKAIERLCDDDSMRTKIANNAFKTISEKEFTWVQNAEKVVSIAQKLSDSANKIDKS